MSSPPDPTRLLPLAPGRGRPATFTRVRPRAVALVLALFGATSCASGTSAPATPAAVAPSSAVFPGAEWERIADPESVGWSRAGLDSVRAALAALPSTGMMAIVGGRVLFEYGDVQAVSYLASVRKSILSMLYGIEVERGKIRLDRTLAQLGIDDIGGLSELETRATVRDLLMARSGVYHAASNPGDNLDDAPPRGSQQPGAYYLYSNWDFNALGTIFEQETGRSIYDALETELVRPIGMRDFDRASHRRTGDSTRSIHLAYHMNLSTRDMARIGYLMLREGNWNGRQIVPRAWVHESTRALTPVTQMNPAGMREGPFGYGYLWWVWDGPWAAGRYRGAYTGLGAVGQHISVLPALDLVVAHKTRPGQGRSVSHGQYREVLERLVRAKR
jgi:CubicO group peptidase (beta-lactamase class C family)